MKALGKNTIFIILALPRWDGKYASTSFALSKEISRSHKVFYIDNPFTLKDFVVHFRTQEVRSRLTALLFGKNIYTNISGEGYDLTAVTPFLMLPINWINNTKLYDWFSRLNNKIFSLTIKRILKDYALKDYIFINSYNPFYARHLPAYFKPKLFIYHTIDDISESLYVDKYGSKLEEEVVKKAHFTVTTSKNLKRLKEKQSSKVYYLPNAADTNIFKKAYEKRYTKPAELKHIGSKVIVYTGHLDHRVNSGLLSKVAETYPDTMLLLIGPVSLNAKEVKSLKKYPNIIFTGKKKLTELPSYLQYAHCAIIPFKCNKLTESIYPLKINEYLAAGLPVVSTSFSEDILDFSQVTYIADNEESFINYIAQAMEEDCEALKRKRMKAAEKNTWSERIAQLLHIIDENLNLQQQENDA